MNKLKQLNKGTRIFVAALVVALLFVGGTAFAAPKEDKPPKEDKKVTICHATSSETNPWTRTVVSENATAGHFENNGTTKAGHEGDKLFEGDVVCPTVVVTPPNEEEPEEPGKETPVETPAPTETPTETPVTTVTETVEDEPVEVFQGK